MGAPDKPGASVPGGARTITATPSAAPATTVIQAPPFQITNVSTAARWIKLLVYGGPGAGKTRLVGSSVLVPQMRDILLIDCEGGDITLSTINEPEWADLVSEHINAIRVGTFRQLGKVQEYLKLHARYRDMNNDEGDDKLKALEKALMSEEDYDPDREPWKYNTAIIDSLSEAETYSMYQLLGITDRTRLDEEMADQGWPEFRKNQTQVLRTIRAFRDVPMNILMTCASEYIQNETKKFVYKPALTGKLAKQCQGFMDIVGFLAITANKEGEEVRRMFVKPGERWDGKCRFSSFKEPFYENPTLKTILQSVGLLEGAGAVGGVTKK